MSDDILPTFESIRTTLDSAKQQSTLSGSSRIQALESELDQLVQINETIDNVIGSIEVTSNNLDVVLETSDSTNKLLDLWVKILSQTGYTTALLNDKNWRGLNKDEEDYQEQLKKFEELNRRYNAEKQKREQERETLKQRKQVQEQKQKEREESLRRRVYGSSSGASSSSRVSKNGSSTGTRTASSNTRSVVKGAGSSSTNRK